jgi:hypothetical protein
MNRSAPLLTLAAVAVLGAALLVLNLAEGNRQPAPLAVAEAPTAAAPTGTAESVPAATEAPPTAAAPEAAVVTEMAYAGRSSGDEVTVALAVRDGRAVGYICDGRRIEAWVEGTVTGDQVSLVSASGRTKVLGTLDETAAVGTVSVDDRQWPYEAKAVVAPAGLYEGRANVDGVATRIGWIVENDGRVTGLATAEGGDQPLPAPPLDPAAPDTVQIDGTPVTVTAVTG